MNHLHLLRAFRAEIARRGGEIEIHDKGKSTTLDVISTGRSEGRRVYLLKATGWRYYSRREPARFVAIAYLCGHDDSGVWARRVPGTCKSASEAVRWLVPAAVRSARSKRLPVVRQGDAYFIPAAADHLDDLPSGHILDRYHVARHRQHAPVTVPFYCRAIPQRFIGMGRGGRASGD